MKSRDLETVLDALLAMDELVQDVGAAVEAYHDVQLGQRCRRAERRIQDAITTVVGFRGSERAARWLAKRNDWDPTTVGLPAATAETRGTGTPLGGDGRVEPWDVENGVID